MALLPQGSIALRLFWFSLLWLVAALAFTAFLLSGLYSRSLDNTLQETLEFHLETLVGVAADTETRRFPPNSVADPRFARPASGWYWQIKDQNGDILGASPSLVGTELPSLDGQVIGPNMTTDVQQDGFGTQIRLIERGVSNESGDLTITVSGNLDEIFELVAGFRGQTIIVLGAVGAMLAIMSAVLARFALRPIGRLRLALEQVRDGGKQNVEGSYPSEIAPLAEEINELLRSNASIIDRARNQVGNLAHGLKTPLAVLRNEAQGKSTDLPRMVVEQTGKMSDLVTRYLDRAQLAARTAVVGRRSDANKALERLTRVLAKLHPEIDLAFSSTSEEVWFRGEAADLEEMVGNLLENACKWAKSAVRITSAQGKDNNTRTLKITIEDDGPGLSEADAQKVLQRGVRLDEKAPGSGLGLDIVKELAGIYGGEITLDRSELGGLRAILTLPSAGTSK